MIAGSIASGRAGLWIGGAAVVVPPVAAFFKILSEPTYLVVLAHALEHAYLALRGHGGVIPDDEQLAIAQLVGAFIAMLGGFTLALLIAYYGVRKAAASPVPADPGGASSPSPSAAADKGNHT